MDKQIIYPANFPLGRRLGRLSRLYYGALLKKLEKLEIERHYSILTILDSTKGKCSQQYISDLLGTDKATMVRMIDYLTDKGHIKRVDDPSDRRAYQIQLTAKGKKILPAIKKGTKDLNDIALDGLSKKEKNIFFKTLEIIYDNIIDEPSHTVIMKVPKIKKH